MTSDRRIRVGAVSYLNTKPLVYGLEQLAPQASLVFDVPSRLAEQLATGQLDVALIPSVECFQDPGYTIVSDACIGCRGPGLKRQAVQPRRAARNSHAWPWTKARGPASP